MEFSRWLLAQGEDFPNKVIFSDEKWFTEKLWPNKQTERYWAREDPEIEYDCMQQGGKKVMCWAAIIDGRVIVKWYKGDGRVNQHSYLATLNDDLWPEIHSVATRRGYWMQQDGATSHTTNLVLDWLEDKFEDRVISRKTQIPWPAKSPDLAPNDYWLWSICLGSSGRQVVSEFCESLSPSEVKSATKNIRKRAQACIEAEGGAFEHRLGKYKNVVVEE